MRIKGAPQCRREMPSQPYRILNYSKICQVAQLRIGRGRYEDWLRRALLIDPHTLSSHIA